METTNFKIGLTSVFALGCAGLTYLILKRRYRTAQVVDILTNLNIEIVTTDAQCTAVVQELRRKCVEYKAIGFDCEWVTEHGKRQPVALVQLSSFDGYCGLFRLSQIKDVPQSLKDLLEDNSIYKVGVAPGDDAKYLAQDYSVYLQSSLDIRHLAQLCGQHPGGLASLSKALLDVVLDKSWRIRCSNWSAEHLSGKQVQYAALDAYVAIKIFVLLINEYCQGGGLLSWLYRRDRNGWRGQNLEEVCAKYADISFKTKQNLKKKDDLANGKTNKEGKEMKAFSKRYPHATRSKPLYHNCFLQAPDGELLCTCDNKKALWYVEKQLADMVKESPLTVRLRFEPAGRSVGDVGKYYQLIKENKCVVCGGSNSYIRKNVVPKEYRKYFPEIMKDHSSHDIVLLCSQCHQRSNIIDQLVRDRLAKICDAPVSAPERGKYTEDLDSRKVRSAARALHYQSRKHVLPEHRRKELETILLQHFPQYDEITQDMLDEASNMQVVFENADFESHGHKVVQYYMENDGLLRLEELWRQHFLDSMRPLYMPHLWSIKHNEERLRVRLNEGRLSEDDSKLLGLV